VMSIACKRLSSIGLLCQDPELERHLDGCDACAHIARGFMTRRCTASTLVIAPPLDMQRQLAQLAFDARDPNRRRGGDGWPSWTSVVGSAAADGRGQGLAAVMLALASWQIFGVLSAFKPVVGDVGYAMEAGGWLTGGELPERSAG